MKILLMMIIFGLTSCKHHVSVVEKDVSVNTQKQVEQVEEVKTDETTGGNTDETTKDTEDKKEKRYPAIWVREFNSPHLTKVKSEWVICNHPMRRNNGIIFQNNDETIFVQANFKVEAHGEYTCSTAIYVLK